MSRLKNKAGNRWHKGFLETTILLSMSCVSVIILMIMQLHHL